MRLASFNVENLFARARVLNLPSAQASPLLTAYARIGTLLARPKYRDADKAAILTQLATLDLLDDDQGSSLGCAS